MAVPRTYLCAAFLPPPRHVAPVGRSKGDSCNKKDAMFMKSSSVTHPPAWLSAPRAALFLHSCAPLLTRPGRAGTPLLTRPAMSLRLTLRVVCSRRTGKARLRALGPARSPRSYRWITALLRGTVRRLPRRRKVRLPPLGHGVTSLVSAGLPRITDRLLGARWDQALEARTRFRLRFGQLHWHSAGTGLLPGRHTDSCFQLTTQMLRTGRPF